MFNPFELDATGLLIWGIVAHLIADWPLQNDWMSANKAKRRPHKAIQRDPLFHPHHPVATPETWWSRHPAAYVHAGIHGLLLALVFGLVAVPLALVHLVIDTRVPVVWWSKLMRQTQPTGRQVWTEQPRANQRTWEPIYDIGTEVRIWTDQVFHVASIAIAALLVSLL